MLARWIDRAHLRFQHDNSSTSVSSDVKGVGGCEMNPPDHSDMSQRVASSVAPEVTAVGSAYQEFPVVSDLIDFRPHPEKVSTSSSDTELLRNCLCSGKDTDSRNESNDI